MDVKPSNGVNSISLVKQLKNHGNAFSYAQVASDNLRPNINSLTQFPPLPKANVQIAPNANAAAQKVQKTWADVVKG